MKELVELVRLRGLQEVDWVLPPLTCDLPARRPERLDRRAATCGSGSDQTSEAPNVVAVSLGQRQDDDVATGHQR
jgi:hypothetical protein